SDDEVGLLIDDFNEMLSQINPRDDALKTAQADLVARIAERTQANVELQSALTRLSETQEQLVQQEKMASLGGLVAGVPPEINTPVGVGVTAASTLNAKSATLREDYEAGRLTKSGLLKYVETATQASSIILTNLNRAAELIQSFKQVAVDQSTIDIRSFNAR